MIVMSVLLLPMTRILLFMLSRFLIIILVRGEYINLPGKMLPGFIENKDSGSLILRKICASRAYPRGLATELPATIAGIRRICESLAAASGCISLSQSIFTASLAIFSTG